jgi:uncharacterized protein (TIGR03545 family)
LRKKFLLIVSVPLAVLIVVVILFHNSWIKSGLEYGFEEVVGAKVEIEDLNLNLSPLGLEWGRMQAANPNNTWRNLFETGHVKFSMDFNQLLRGKYIIDELTIENLTLDTKRATEGSIDPERKQRAILGGKKLTFSKLVDDAFKNTITTTPLFDIVKIKKGYNADSLIKALDLKTVKHIDTLKSWINRITEEWSSIKTEYEKEKSKVLDIGKQIAAINPAELNDVQKITNAIMTVDNATKTVNEITNLAETKSVSVRTDLEKMKLSIGQIDNFVKSDFEKLKSMARLPSINTKGMAQVLVGNEMYKRAKNYVYWADAARANVQKYQSKPDYEYPERMKGQNIKFPVERGYPKFWIKKISISGGTDKAAASDYFRAEGNALNISDNQDLSGAPITVSLEGTGNNNRRIKLAGLIERRKNTQLDKIEASLSNIPVGEFSLGNSEFLPSKITDALMSTELRITVPGNKIDASARILLNNIKLNFESEPKNIVERLVREVLVRVNDFSVSMRLWNTDGGFDIAFSTDLDEKLTEKVSAVMGEEIAKLQAELKSKFDAVVNEEIQKFRKIYEAKVQDVQNQIGGYTTLFSDKLNLIDNKKQELVAQLDKQKQGFLEDKLRGLFKK